MIGLLLLYYIGKLFYDLAQTHDKNKWLFAILSIVIYYAGLFIGGILVAIISQICFNYNSQNLNSMLIGIMALPVGILFVWLFHKFLIKKWSNRDYYEQSDILDENITIN